jgi:UDP-glucose 4-epimerase
LGTANVLQAAISHYVKKVVVLSTDKAVYPCNALGASKMLAEKIAVEKSREQNRTEICLTRFGNLVMSRGSAIPLFLSQIREKKPITITDPQMTRFFMTIDDAIELVLMAFEDGRNGELFIENAVSCRLDDVVNGLLHYLHADNKVVVRGTRHGERMFECLLTDEESHYATEYNGFIRIDLSFNAERKPAGIPHFDSNSPERLLDTKGTCQIMKGWMQIEQ